MRVWSIIFFLATASLIYNSLFDEDHSGGVRALGVAASAITLLIAVVLWRRATSHAHARR